MYIHYQLMKSRQDALLRTAACDRLPAQTRPARPRTHTTRPARPRGA